MANKKRRGTADSAKLQHLQNSFQGGAIVNDDNPVNSRGGLKQLLPSSLSEVIIHYDEPWKVKWNQFIMLLTLYSLIVTPFNLAFPNARTDRNFEILVDLFFIADVLLCFRTTLLLPDGDEELDPHHLALRYAQTWLGVDLTAAIPLESILHAASNIHPLVRALLPLNRILRLGRLYKQLSLIESGGGRIMTLLLAFLLSAHSLGCFFFFISSSDSHNLPPGWVSERGLETASVPEQYSTSLYWALTTISTVGYGDVVAVSYVERVFASCSMLFGATIYAIIFGTMATLIQNLDRAANMRNDKIALIKDFCNANKLPSFIQSRLREYVRADWNLRKGLSSEVVFESVPLLVRAELLMFMYADLIRTVPIFADCSRRFLERVVLKFRARAYLVGDLLIREARQVAYNHMR